MSEPVVKAVLFCKYATIDKVNRWSLIDIFGTMLVKSVPSYSQPFHVFVHAVDVPKSPTLLFQIEDPKGLVVWTSGPMPFENSMNGIQYLSAVPPFLVVTPGRFRVAFYVNSDRLVDSELVVEMAQESVPQ